ncbi:hypothetical protein EPUS_06111 [Endocarpon pusillum Z07020]|uniref:Bacteriophage T5 Orf172 DNA-binding domain-containing protein n=1 Tax=Endocarpon pusillum (strain Z07020 / HMAS-L-300199) TaxID=1263415 RepID=U1HPN0_ENDPU|nr:uncharacterized protein EPUS_06111 [Endocarpon pusillum Z07020]ERF72355.1 hypothetical protein EPUS_06111 [Endocarpon pusillum Z07020]
MTIWELPRVIDFKDLTPEEDFYTCVHLTRKSGSRRCGNTNNKQDRQEARRLYLKIRFFLDNATPVQDLLQDFAKVALCKRIHRPNDGTDTPYLRMAQKWSNDVEKKQLAIQQLTEELAIEAVMSDADVLHEKVVDRSDGEGTQTSNANPTSPEFAPCNIILKVEQPSMAVTSGDDSALGKPTTLASEQNACRDTIDLPICEPRQPDSQSGAISIAPPQPLPKRITRSGTSTNLEKEYVPYCPYLSARTPTQIIQATNASVLSILNRPLTIMAKKSGRVYIFTRPDDPALLKTGFTTHSGEARVAAWGKDCCYAAKLEFVTEMMPHAWLVERLVQEHLKQYRRKERRCKWKDSCSKQHIEWYEIGVKEARRVIESWAGWIQKYRPWGSDDVLTPTWASLLNQYRIALKGPDCDKEMWDRFVRMEEPRKVVPVGRSAASKQDLNTSISSFTVHTTELKLSCKSPLPELQTTLPKRVHSDSSSAPSLSPSQPRSPSKPPRRSIRQTQLVDIQNLELGEFPTQRAAPRPTAREPRPDSPHLRLSFRRNLDARPRRHPAFLARDAINPLTNLFHLHSLPLHIHAVILGYVFYHVLDRIFAPHRFTYLLPRPTPN